MNSESTSNDLTSETRNTLIATETLPSSDLKIFENRLNSFNSWPLVWLSPTSLASAGFFYFNIGDQVKCAFCGGIIGQWEFDDSPIEEHRKFFPECSVVRSQETQADVIEEESGIQSVRTPKSPEFSTLDSRLRSYATWDSAIQDPRTLSQAGFYFLGASDEVSEKNHKNVHPTTC